MNNLQKRIHTHIALISIFTHPFTYPFIRLRSKGKENKEFPELIVKNGRQGGRREEGSGWGTRVYLWWIHVDIWQNQYNIIKLKNKIKVKKKGSLKFS